MCVDNDARFFIEFSFSLSLVTASLSCSGSLRSNTITSVLADTSHLLARAQIEGPVCRLFTREKAATVCRVIVFNCFVKRVHHRTEVAPRSVFFLLLSFSFAPLFIYVSQVILIRRVNAGP